MAAHPIVYEINTRCWLSELAPKHGARITLANVPDSQFETWQNLGFTHIWLMGVWASGSRSRAEALTNPYLHRAYSEVLPDWRPEDVCGSPYAIADYHVPPELGGENGLQQFRNKLHKYGMKLLLDFVPNHLGIDHPWLTAQPDLFVQSPTAVPGTFRQETTAGVRWLAHGKDPFFPPWTDTVQLDYRRAATRKAMTDLLLSVAERCDGVRCDMAMLLLSDVFSKTWEHFPVTSSTPNTGEPLPIPEFWGSAVPAVKAVHPDFLFLAEIYWGLEPRLQALGFDYTYDKSLYDELVARNSWKTTTNLESLPSSLLPSIARRRC
jgi:glycosidase